MAVVVLKVDQPERFVSVALGTIATWASLDLVLLHRLPRLDGPIQAGTTAVV
ncbi:hypothetical protein Thimo_2625 [Thioflavicoccus mobilis 8321]|uniref:Uncharacterized protein n=1 Tax=Thioflavicoccus mobilis 8321 TaxID=765912 RepID=L0GZF4_9GAMM|nr:hypothetical protein Thimo_2625 [Thioflavicoccus mobilis 8321]